MRDASAFMASSVVSYDIVADGNAHMLPIVIDPKPHGGLAVSCGDATVDVQQRDAIDDAAAELVRRAVDEVFVTVNDFGDADIGGFRRDEPRSRATGTADAWRRNCRRVTITSWSLNRRRQHVP